MMQGRSFLSHINVNDDEARDEQREPVDNVHLQAGKRLFTTHVNVNDDLRRELDPKDLAPAWDGFGGTATANGLPLYAPARYLGRSATQATQAPPRPRLTAPIKRPVMGAGGGVLNSPKPAPAPAAGVVVEEVDRWPWWIWPLAAAAAVAVRGS